MNDMHGPWPTTPVGDSMVQIIAQIVHHKTGNQCGPGQWQGIDLKLLCPDQHAKGQKSGCAVGEHAEQTHENAHAVIFCMQAATLVEIAHSNNLGENEKEKHRYRAQNNRRGNYVADIHKALHVER